MGQVYQLARLFVEQHKCISSRIKNCWFDTLLCWTEFKLKKLLKHTVGLKIFRHLTHIIIRNYTPLTSPMRKPSIHNQHHVFSKDNYYFFILCVSFSLFKSLFFQKLYNILHHACTVKLLSLLLKAIYCCIVIWRK